MGNGPAANRAFGRRPGQNTAPREQAHTQAPTPAPPQAGDAGWTDHDPELLDWKRAQRWQPPWRQIAFMASLCFGIGSLVLPAMVNDGVQRLLYGLTAASFAAGWRKRRA